MTVRLRIVRIIFGKELRELFRDRRTLAVMFGVPLVLYPLLLLLAGWFGTTHARQQSGRRSEGPAITWSHVAVVNPAAAPRLSEILRDEAFGIRVEPSADPDTDLAAGTIEAVVRIPDREQSALLAGGGERITIGIDRSRMSSSVAERRIERALASYEKWVIERRLAAHGADVRLLAPVARVFVDRSRADQRLGLILATALPAIVLMMAMLGAFFPALAATTTERESGTLEALLVTPAHKIELLAGKAAFVFLSALVTAGLNLGSMVLVAWRIISQLPADDPFHAVAIRPLNILLVYVATVPTIAAFAACALILGLVAKSFREANTLAAAIMLLPLASVGVTVADPAASLGLLITPIANTTIIIRDVFAEHAHFGHFALAFVSGGMFAGLLLSAAARLFTSERLVDTSWEPLSLAGFAKGTGGPRVARLPAIDEAVAVVFVSVLLLFYLAPVVERHGFFALLTASEVGFVMVPTLAFAVLARLAWTETFALRRPRLANLVGASCIGVGIAVWASLVGSLQLTFWRPPEEAVRALVGLLARPMEAHPIATPLAVGIGAGACEELLYRGLLQTALLRRLRPWTALAITAAVFAAAHADPWGMPVRFAIGLVLGGLVYKTRSIFARVAAHALYDATQLVAFGHALRARGGASIVDSVVKAQVEWNPPALLASTVLVAVGCLLLRQGSGDPSRPGRARAR